MLGIAGGLAIGVALARLLFGRYLLTRMVLAGLAAALVPALVLALAVGAPLGQAVSRAALGVAAGVAVVLALVLVAGGGAGLALAWALERWSRR